MINVITVAITSLGTNLPRANFALQSTPSLVLNELILRGFSSWFFASIPEQIQAFNGATGGFALLYLALCETLYVNGRKENSMESLAYNFWFRFRKPKYCKCHDSQKIISQKSILVQRWISN